MKRFIIFIKSNGNTLLKAVAITLMLIGIFMYYLLADLSTAPDFVYANF